jgi:hypothetical protein
MRPLAPVDLDSRCPICAAKLVMDTGKNLRRKPGPYGHSFRCTCSCGVVAWVRPASVMYFKAPSGVRLRVRRVSQ